MKNENNDNVLIMKIIMKIMKVIIIMWIINENEIIMK